MGLADLAVILVAGLASAALIVVMRPLFARYALARPNARSSHKAPTPQGGGVAVVLGGFIALVAVALLGQAHGPRRAGATRHRRGAADGARRRR